MIKKVLMIIPFETIYPPMNGGMHRCINILDQLAKCFDVTAIMHQRSEDFSDSVKEFPSLGKVKVYSTQAHTNKKDFFSLLPQRAESALRTRWLIRSWKKSADSNLLRYHSLLKSLLKSKCYDVIVLEKLSTLNAVPMIRRYQGKACIIYDAHNVDSNLALDRLKDGLITKNDFSSINESESTLYKTVDGMLVCSVKDLEGYVQLNKGVLHPAIIPNGVRFLPSLKEGASEMDFPLGIIFCGALNYDPNIEGLLWFYNAVWPLVRAKLPALTLTVIGSGAVSGELSSMQTDPSILFIGKVADVKEYYSRAAVSIVPLKRGSGTRLKILEAMSLGVPVISTSKGAEGIEYEKDKNIIIADSEELFAKRLIDLVTKKEDRILLKKNARLLIEAKYDWDVIGGALRVFVEKFALVQKSLKGTM